MTGNLSLDEMIEILKGVGEPSRLRILALLNLGDLTVSDLTTILGQSQPRVSRHLKLLLEAQLIERYQEGAWAYFRLSDRSVHRAIINHILAPLRKDDHLISLDLERLAQVKAARQSKAAAYFSANAASWDKIRLLHAPDNAIEKAMQDVIGPQPFQSMLDIGTGTGSLLKLFAPLYDRGLGVDINRDMLAVARVNLDNAGITHAQVRQGDVATLPVERESFDLVTIYQVLHFLDEPQLAIREAARVMRAGGRLLIVDFAPHNLDYLRDEHAHLRLGFSDLQISEWLSDAGLVLDQTLEFKPQDNGRTTPGLTVKLWLCRDLRMLMADHTTTEKA